MADFLAAMAASSAERARSVDLADVRARAADVAPRRLAADGFALIAEVKLRAPSSGVLAAPADPVATAAARARAYAEAGAAAISVLTEPSRFDGHLDHLAAAAAAPAPVMRKDFLVHPAQVWEARAAGASGVLLIATMLSDAALDDALAAAAEAGLFVLLEAFDAADLARAGRVLAAWSGPQPLWVGLNCRDLRTLQVDPGRFEALADAMPAGTVGVAESGIDTPEDAARVARLGYGAVLVGSALMRAPDPGALVRALIAGGRGR